MARYRITLNAIERLPDKLGATFFAENPGPERPRRIVANMAGVSAF